MSRRSFKRWYKMTLHRFERRWAKHSLRFEDRDDQ